jgi:hypothetical protein
MQVDGGRRIRLTQRVFLIEQDAPQSVGIGMAAASELCVSNFAASLIMCGLGRIFGIRNIGAPALSHNPTTISSEPSMRGPQHIRPHAPSLQPMRQLAGAPLKLAIAETLSYHAMASGVGAPRQQLGVVDGMAAGVVVVVMMARLGGENVEGPVALGDRQPRPPVDEPPPG